MQFSRVNKLLKWLSAVVDGIKQKMSLREPAL